MNDANVMEAGRRCLMMALQLSLPILLFGLVAGVLVSIFQAVTSIQEVTLTFVPKLLAVVLALALFGPWMLSMAVHYTTYMFTHMEPVLR